MVLPFYQFALFHASYDIDFTPANNLMYWFSPLSPSLCFTAELRFLHASQLCFIISYLEFGDFYNHDVVCRIKRTCPYRKSPETGFFRSRVSWWGRPKNAEQASNSPYRGTTSPKAEGEFRWRYFSFLFNLHVVATDFNLRCFNSRHFRLDAHQSRSREAHRMLSDSSAGFSIDKVRISPCNNPSEALKRALRSMASDNWQVPPCMLMWLGFQPMVLRCSLQLWDDFHETNGFHEFELFTILFSIKVKFAKFLKYSPFSHR